MTAPITADPAALERLQAHFDGMPPVAAMQVGVTGWDGDCLRLSAPLATHVNDKGCAFGGSLVSLATLAAWGLVTLQVEAAGLDADVFVAATEVRYRAPLFADLHARPRQHLAGRFGPAARRWHRHRGTLALRGDPACAGFRAGAGRLTCRRGPTTGCRRCAGCGGARSWR